ncbi:MAG: hypothetical protein ABSF26_21865 [Thermoguttaceae bacterium]|jgi:hypothetical protein
MPLSNNSAGPGYSFENDVSGRLFCWLIESGQVDFQAMIEQAAQGQADPQSWVKRLADALKARVGQSWALLPPPPACQPAGAAVPRPKAPAYTIWFRPSPSKKIKFKEVARALLVFTGRVPPADG